MNYGIKVAELAKRRQRHLDRLEGVRKVKNMLIDEDTEIRELPKYPNLQYFNDANGEGWYCTGPDEESGHGGVCYHADDVIYDRSFGG